MAELRKMRLQRLIAQRTTLSRRVAEEAILDGRVAVNGKIVKTLGTSVIPDIDRVSLDKCVLRIKPKPTHIAYYKPRHIIVSNYDPQGRPTIWEDLSRWKGKVNPAGRLDFDAEGLLILSNDGELLQRITHPSHEMVKVYHVKIKDVPSEAELNKLKQGVRVGAAKVYAAEVEILKQEGRHTWISLGIHEGKFHQVKKMCEIIGHPVLKLKRVAIGPIKLGRLEKGEWRFLGEREVARIMAL